MQAFTRMEGVVAPVDLANVDTDAIIPKQYLKSVKRTGFGPNLFDDWRYLDPGDLSIDNATRRLNPDCMINQDRYKNASILVARENFGCGSSREHAVWALENFGFRVVISPSFAEIFFNNCFKNGVLPIVLPDEEVGAILSEVAAQPGYSLSVDLEEQSVTRPDGTVLSFDIGEFRKHCLLNGLDDIGLTLQHEDDIRAFEAGHKAAAPWLFIGPQA